MHSLNKIDKCVTGVQCADLCEALADLCPMPLSCVNVLKWGHCMSAGLVFQQGSDCCWEKPVQHRSSGEHLFTTLN